MAQVKEWDTADGALIYESSERGCCYKYIRCLWCACTEPYHKITTKYVRVHKWDGCSQITDSMAMEAVMDVTREQSCCCCMASCCCGCCINDFGDLVLYGVDETEEDGQLKLVNVADSDSVMVTITKHLQEIHEDFRKHGKALGKKINQIKHSQQRH
eukprot:265665_1